MSEIPRGCSEKKIWFWDHLPFRSREIPLPQRKRDRVWTIKENTGRAIFERFATWAIEDIFPNDINEWLDRYDQTVGGSLRHSLSNFVIEMKRGNLVLVPVTRTSHLMSPDDPILNGGQYGLRIRSMTPGNKIRTVNALFIGIVINTNHHFFDPIPERPRYMQLPHKEITDSITALLYANNALVQARRSDRLSNCYNQSELDAAIDWVLFAN